MTWSDGFSAPTVPGAPVPREIATPTTFDPGRLCERYYPSLVPKTPVSASHGASAAGGQPLTTRLRVGEPERSVPSRSIRERPMQARQATLAARRYFLDDWTIKDIAAELGVSRFKAARLIDWARAEGIVRIEIVNTLQCDVGLSAGLRSAFGLQDALVVSGLDGRSHAIAPELAEVAARVVSEVVTGNDVVGISWGHTLDLLVERLQDFSAKQVVQLIGGLATLENASGGVELVRLLATKAGTAGYPLLAPARLRDPGAADALRRDPIVAETLRLIDDVTVVLAGIGSWGVPPVSRLIECFDETELRTLRERGVVADMCGFLFTADGEVLEPLNNERIGITLAQLEITDTVLAVSGGLEKREALAAVLRSGIVDILVTDAGSAQQLLRT